MNISEYSGMLLAILASLLSYNHYPYWMSYGAGIASVILCITIPYYIKMANEEKK